MQKKLIIIGASTSAKIARFYFEKDTTYRVTAFSVQKEYLKNPTYEGLPVVALESLHQTHPPSEYECFVAIGYSKMNSIREHLYLEVKRMSYVLPNYISPQCTFLTSESIGDNNFILEDNTIQPFVSIGSNNVFWSGNHIGHDVKIGDHNFISSHVVISGYTEVENNCFLGVNSSLHDSIKIRNKTLIAAGAVISTDTNEEDVIVPAKSVTLTKKSIQLGF